MWPSSTRSSEEWRPAWRGSTLRFQGSLASGLSLHSQTGGQGGGEVSRQAIRQAGRRVLGTT